MIRKFNPRTRKIQKAISCINEKCEMHKKQGSVVIMAETKRKRPVPIYECLACHKHFTERKRTPLFG